MIKQILKVEFNMIKQILIFIKYHILTFNSNPIIEKKMHICFLFYQSMHICLKTPLEQIKYLGL